MKIKKFFGMVINWQIKFLKNRQWIRTAKISDGYHTFEELYYHRMYLFATICHTYRDKAWKSWIHHDGTMFDGSFIVGVTTPKGDYSYHYNAEYWHLFDVPIMGTAPVFDGHKPSDIVRLMSLVEKGGTE